MNFLYFHRVQSIAFMMGYKTIAPRLSTWGFLLKYFAASGYPCRRRLTLTAGSTTVALDDEIAKWVCLGTVMSGRAERFAASSQ